MNSDAPLYFVLILLYSMTMFALGGVAQEKHMQKIAIKNNAAHWATDTNGAAVFTWGK
jgi:hypothetical protein